MQGARGDAREDNHSPSNSNLMSLDALAPSSFKFFSICLLRAMAARSSADEAHPMAIARTAWVATRGSAGPLACSRVAVAVKTRSGRDYGRPSVCQSCRKVAPRRIPTLEWRPEKDCRATSQRTLPAQAATLLRRLVFATSILARRTILQLHLIIF